MITHSQRVNDVSLELVGHSDHPLPSQIPKLFSNIYILVQRRRNCGDHGGHGRQALKVASTPLITNTILTLVCVT